MHFSFKVVLLALGATFAIADGTTVDGTTFSGNGQTIDLTPTATSSSSSGMAPAITAGVQAVVGMGLMGAAALL